MNKIVKGLLVAALALSAQNVAAHTNKTTISLRNQALHNLPLEVTTTKERTSAKIDDRCGATVTATGFYGQNTKNDQLGEYLGFSNKNVIKVAPANGDIVGTTMTAAAAGEATIKFAPEIIEYGVNLAWNQDLSKLINGLNFKVLVPVDHKEQDVKMAVSGASKDAVVSYLNGKSAEALKYGKIDGKRTETGVANIEAQLGYKFLDKETYNAGVNVAVVIPTGSKVTAEYSFAPTVGSKNWGLGAGLDAQARVWGTEDHNVKLNFAANYRYMFEATEKRILGLKDKNWGQYLLNAAGVPTANVTTVDTKVTPGNQLDGIVGVAYNNGGFTADLGYNLYFKEAEAVKTKVAVADVTLAGAPAATKVDATAAETPAQFTNGVYAGVGYAFKEWEYPVMLGLGGKYEFAAKNSAAEGWQGCVKAGLSF